MAEDNAAPIEDTPQPPAEPEHSDSQAQEGQGTPEQETVNWQERYENLQPEYTRATQEAAYWRSVEDALHSDDPQQRQAAAEALGLEFADDGASEEQDALEDGPQDSRLDEMWRNHQEQQQMQEVEEFRQAVGDNTAEALGSVLEANGREFGGPDDPGMRLMYDRTFDLIMNGWEPVEAAQDAFSLIDQLTKGQQQQWLASKRTSTPALGQEAVEQPNLDTHADRAAYIKARIGAENAAQ